MDCGTSLANRWIANSALRASSGNQMGISKPPTNHRLECDEKVTEEPATQGAVRRRKLAIIPAST